MVSTIDNAMVINLYNNNFQDKTIYCVSELLKYWTHCFLAVKAKYKEATQGKALTTNQPKKGVVGAGDISTSNVS